MVSGPSSGHVVVAGPSDAFDRQAGGGAAAAVEAVQAPLAGIPDEREGVATEAAGVAIDDGQHRVGRDRGVNGGAACAQRVDAGGGGERVGRDDHATRGGGGGHRSDRSRKKRAP